MDPACPDENTLGMLVGGDLPDGDRARLEDHLDRCPACSEVVAEYGRSAPAPSIEPSARYRVIRRLGAGGMGEVWEADDTSLGRRVAVKFVRPDASADRAYQARLVREARALARLHHPNVVTVYDLSQSDDGDLFLALELVEGVTARAWQAAGRRSTRQVLDAWCRVADGLAAVHGAGVVHRDLKPENVLVTRADRVVICDFGMASVATGSGSTTLTASGQIIGTPLYMPLEQLRGHPATAKSDQFSLCVCLWEALAGARPFDDVPTLAGRIRAMEAAPAIPRRHRRIFAVLARGLAADPAARWRDVAALRRAIDRARARPRWWAALALLLAALVVVALVR